MVVRSVEWKAYWKVEQLVELTVFQMAERKVIEKAESSVG